MFTILLHSSKTMRRPMEQTSVLQQPLLIKDAVHLSRKLKALTETELQEIMAISPAMARKTFDLVQAWDERGASLPAIDIFLGDIYSGLQVRGFSKQDRHYANRHLYILSGMYGVLRALDQIQPYRLEMGYKLPDGNLYTFWGSKIASVLPTSEAIINLSAVEYTKAVLPHIKDTPVISPKFLTLSPRTGEPTFVTVHAKIARGAFAHWLISERIDTTEELKNFTDLGYRYNKKLSTLEEPVFVAKEFKGIGLSVRLS